MNEDKEVLEIEMAVGKAMSNPGTKSAVCVLTEKQAYDLVSTLALTKGRFSLVSGNGKECVDAKSFLGVTYFMVVHPNDTYLVYENDN